MGAQQTPDTFLLVHVSNPITAGQCNGVNCAVSTTRETNAATNALFRNNRRHGLGTEVDTVRRLQADLLRPLRKGSRVLVAADDEAGHP